MPALDFWFDFASTYSYPAAMRIGPLAAAAGVAVRYRPFLLGPIFKAQGWDTSPFNVYEPRAATCGATSSGCAPTWRCRSGGPSRSRRTACWRRGWRWSGSTTAGARPSAGRCFAPSSREGRRIDDAAVIGDILAGLKLDPSGDSRRRADRRQQAAAASADRRGAAARHFRRADLRHRRRRIVLGQRPAGTRAAMGARSG